MEFLPQYTTGDLITAATLIAVFVGGWVSSRRFQKTVEQSNRATSSAYYAELDRYFHDLLAVGVNNAHLHSPRQQSDADVLAGRYEPFEDQEKRQQYDAYARMVWCFVETVHDRCLDCPDPLERKRLIDVWSTAIETENRVHRGWFLNEVRQQLLRQRDDPGEMVSSGFNVFVVEKQWRDADWTYRADFASPLDLGEPSEIETHPLPREGRGQGEGARA